MKGGKKTVVKADFLSLLPNACTEPTLGMKGIQFAVGYRSESRSVPLTILRRAYAPTGNRVTLVSATLNALVGSPACLGVENAFEPDDPNCSGQFPSILDYLSNGRIAQSVIEWYYLVAGWPVEPPSFIFRLSNGNEKPTPQPIRNSTAHYSERCGLLFSLKQKSPKIGLSAQNRTNLSGGI